MDCKLPPGNERQSFLYSRDVKIYTFRNLSLYKLERSLYHNIMN